MILILTKFEYFNDENKIMVKEVDKDVRLPQLNISLFHADLSKINGRSNPYIDSETIVAHTLQEAVNILKEKFWEYEKKSFDWKAHSHGCYKLYWEDEQKREVLTYLRLIYRGNEVTQFDMKALGF